MSEITEASANAERSYDEDRLSSLPDEVLSSILSRLHTKEAVKTCVLNKGLIDKWYMLDKFTLEECRGDDLHKEAFLQFMEKVVSRVEKIASFEVHCHKEYNWDRISACINAIFKSEIETFIFRNRDTIASNKFPSCILNSSSLLVFRWVAPCTYSVPTENIFNNLKHLEMQQVRFLNENSTGTLFFTFPVLESCCFGECEWVNVELVEINAPNLKKFHYLTNATNLGHYVEERTVKIIGANLTEFRLDGGDLETFALPGTTVERALLLNNEWDGEVETLEFWGLQLSKLIKEFSGLKEFKISALLCVAIDYSESVELDELRQLPQFQIDVNLHSILIHFRGWMLETLQYLLHAFGQNIANQVA